VPVLSSLAPGAAAGEDRGMKAAPSRASLLSRLPLLAALGLTAACATEPAPPTPPGSRASVQALVGDAACESEAQCRTIGVGAKACGGPQAYVAWSTARTDAGALHAAAQREAAADRRETAAKGMVSTCTVVLDPGAFCDIKPSATGPTGVCRLRSGRGGASPLIR